MDNAGKNPARSSIFAYPFTILFFLGCCVLAAFTDHRGLSFFFGFLFLLTLCSRAWGKAALRNLIYQLELPTSGVFPGQTLTVTRSLLNNKLLPLIWVEILEPCEPQGVLVPDEDLIVANPVDAAEHEAPAYSCLYTFTLLGYRQTLRLSDRWEAKRRGIHCISEVLLRSGDGFGLCAASQTVALNPARRVAVYPELVDVSTEQVIKDMWDSRSESHGFLEDTTLVKSVRDYLPGDPARAINQRLLAKGLGLKLNQYESVTPDAVLFLLDTASFLNKPARIFEEVLSILGSLLVGLTKRGIAAGLVVPAFDYFPETCVSPSASELELTRMLELLAAATPGQNGISSIDASINPEQIGQTYYISYSAKNATSISLMHAFLPHRQQLLAWETEEATEWDVRVASIRQFGRVP